MIRRILFCALLAVLLLPAATFARDRNIMLTGFDRIRIDGPFRVELTTDRPPGAVISGDTRAVDSVDVRVEGRTLIVSSSQNQWGGWPGERREPPVITATTHELYEAAVVGGGVLDIDAIEGQRVNLTVTGSGSLTVGTVRADQLVATVAGSGRLDLAGGDSNDARFSTSGTGTIDASKMEAADLTVFWDGPGAGHFLADRSAKVTAMGLGMVDVAGSPSCTVRGPGPVRCGKDTP